MKKLLAVLIFALAALPAHSATTTQAQSVREVVTNESSCVLSTFTVTPTEISGNTSVSSTTFAAYAVSVLNFDTANIIYCSSNSAVNSAGVNRGWPIGASAATGPWQWQLWAISVTQKWYCVASGANTQSLVCRWK